MPSSRYKFVSLPAFLSLIRPNALRKKSTISFVPPAFRCFVGRQTQKESEKSFTTNATAEQQHQSLLEMEISLWFSFFTRRRRQRCHVDGRLQRLSELSRSVITIAPQRWPCSPGRQIFLPFPANCVHDASTEKSFN